MKESEQHPPVFLMSCQLQIAWNKNLNIEKEIDLKKKETPYFKL